jgi:hypothetical protein
MYSSNSCACPAEAAVRRQFQDTIWLPSAPSKNVTFHAGSRLFARRNAVRRMLHELGEVVHNRSGFARKSLHGQMILSV